MRYPVHQPNVHEVRDNLAEYLAAHFPQAAVVCIDSPNQPVARLVAIQAASRRAARPLGLAADAGTPLPDSFFEPLPDELVRALAGQAAARDAEPGL